MFLNGIIYLYTNSNIKEFFFCEEINNQKEFDGLQDKYGFYSQRGIKDLKYLKVQYF